LLDSTSADVNRRSQLDGMKPRCGRVRVDTRMSLWRYYGWYTEVNLRHLKETMKMDVLRCETVEGVQKELAIFAVIYNLVRRVMEVAGRRQGVEPNRISFADAWRWLQHARPGEALPKLVVNPYR